MDILLAFLIACIGLTVEACGLRAIGTAQVRALGRSIATLEADLGIGRSLDVRIAEAVRDDNQKNGRRNPWDGFTLEEIESLSDPDVKIIVWPAGLQREPRKRGL